MGKKRWRVVEFETENREKLLALIEVYRRRGVFISDFIDDWSMLVEEPRLAVKMFATYDDWLEFIKEVNGSGIRCS